MSVCIDLLWQLRVFGSLGNEPFVTYTLRQTCPSLIGLLLRTEVMTRISRPSLRQYSLFPLPLESWVEDVGRRRGEETQLLGMRGGCVYALGRVALGYVESCNSREEPKGLKLEKASISKYLHMFLMYPCAYTYFISEDELCYPILIPFACFPCHFFGGKTRNRHLSNWPTGKTRGE